MSNGTSTVSLTVDDGMTTDSDVVLIIVQDTTAPVVSNASASPNPAAVNTSVTISADVADICAAYTEYTIDGGLTWADMNVPLLSGIESRILEVCVRATDESGNHAKDCFFLPVYDPSGGFVTGGGWIDSPSGAFMDNTALTGKANFGFVSKYKKGATIPTGQTEFAFKTAGLNFHSSVYEWLVVTGNNKAQFKGTGTINGTGDYKFMVWAGDGTPDTFRIRIWEEIGGIEYDKYDNGTDQAIGGGNIVVHGK